MSSTLPAELNRAVIIVGSPRSGTTFLSDIMQAHPDLHYLEEPRLVWRYGNDGRSDWLRAADARPEVTEHIRRDFAQKVQAAGKSRLLEKTPSNALRLSFVDAVLPDCQFIHIRRDGVQSVLSIMKFWEQYAGARIKGRVGRRLKELDLRRAPHYAKEALRILLPGKLKNVAGKPVWGPRLPGIEGMLRDLDLVDVCALQWRMCVEAACHFGRSLPPQRYFECRLEEMSPELVRSMLNFANLADSPEVWRRFEEKFDNTQPTGRTPGADPQLIERIQSWIEPTTHWLESTPTTTEL